MRTIAIASALIASLTLPAYAQMSLGGSGNERQTTRYSEQEKREEAERERQYQNTIRRSGKDSSAAVHDPWAIVRPTTPDKNKR